MVAVSAMKTALYGVSTEKPAQPTEKELSMSWICRPCSIVREQDTADGRTSVITQDHYQYSCSRTQITKRVCLMFTMQP